ncbi:MAG: RING finger domain-containing protein [bacterium]
MICIICLSCGNETTIKAKCCNQLFHVDCLDQWVKQEKFICPFCSYEQSLMAFLPFQKFKMVNAQSSLL